VTARAVTNSMSVFKAFIRPPIRLLCSGSNASGEVTTLYIYDASCCRDMHSRDYSTVMKKKPPSLLIFIIGLITFD
jgi:hypothetical protein